MEFISQWRSARTKRGSSAFIRFCAAVAQFLLCSLHPRSPSILMIPAHGEKKSGKVPLPYPPITEIQWTGSKYTFASQFCPSCFHLLIGICSLKPTHHYTTTPQQIFTRSSPHRSKTQAFIQFQQIPAWEMLISQQKGVLKGHVKYKQHYWLPSKDSTTEAGMSVLNQNIWAPILP